MLPTTHSRTRPKRRKKKNKTTIRSADQIDLGHRNLYQTSLRCLSVGNNVFNCRGAYVNMVGPEDVGKYYFRPSKESAHAESEKSWNISGS